MDDDDRLHKGLNLAEILEYDTSVSVRIKRSKVGFTLTLRAKATSNHFDTLGGRDFSCTVSVFGQLFVVTPAGSFAARGFGLKAEDVSVCGRPRSISAELNRRTRYKKPWFPW